MPGKIADRIMFTLLGGTLLYLFFLNAWGSIPLACALAFLSCLSMRFLIKKRPVRYKCTRRQAESILLSIAVSDDDSAHEALKDLIFKKYPGESCTLVPVLKHPSASLSTGDVFSHWKKHRGEERLLIAATCVSDARAVMYANELRSPKVAVIDRRKLLRIIRTSCPPPEKTAPASLITRLKSIPGRLSLRFSAPKNALFGVLFILMYLFSGNGVYLFSGLFSLFMFGCALPGFRIGKKLFP